MGAPARTFATTVEITTRIWRIVLAIKNPSGLINNKNQVYKRINSPEKINPNVLNPTLSITPNRIPNQSRLETSNPIVKAMLQLYEWGSNQLTHQKARASILLISWLLKYIKRAPQGRLSSPNTQKHSPFIGRESSLAQN